MQSYGKNVLLSTDPKVIKKVYISKKLKDAKIYNYLKEKKIHYDIVDEKAINRMCQANHQGILIIRDDYKYALLEEIYPFDKIVILDHLEDPHNFGAIIRTCEALGVKGIIIPKDRGVLVNDTVIKTSVGTTQYVKIVKVTNLVQTIDILKKKGFFIYGSDMSGINYQHVEFASKAVLIIGNEGKGMSTLVSKKCDEIIKIPMKGKVNSLNASVACAILLMNMGGIN